MSRSHAPSSSLSSSLSSSSSSSSSSSPSLLASLLLAATILGCAQPTDIGGEGEGKGGDEGEGESPVGEGEGEVEGEGEGEEGEGEGEPVPANDTCVNAEPLTSGAPRLGTTVGAKDETPCNDGDSPGGDGDPPFSGGADVAYTFTIADAQGVVINVSEGPIDAVISVFSEAQGCDEAPSAATVCFDNFIEEGEELTIGALEAGTYFIVVESFGRPGTFEIQIDIVDPVCTGDEDDLIERGDGTTGNETAATALALSTPGFGEGYLSQNSNTVDDGLDLHLCDGDVDYYLVGHMGGPLTIAAAGTVTELREAVVDVAATLETGRLVYTEGDAVAGLPGADVDVAAGFYLLRIAEDQVLPVPDFLAYDVIVTHRCEADDLDLPVAGLDADIELGQEPVVLPLAQPVARSLCGDDEDIIPVEVLFEGPLILTLTGVPASLALDLFAVDSGGVETPAAVARVNDEAAGTATFSADVLPGRYRARVRTPGIAATTPYTWDVTLPGLDGVPGNDACADAIEVVPGTPAAGRTVGATPDFAGTCNDESIFQSPANDVYFRFSLAEPTATLLTLTRLVDYSGTLAVFALPPDGACPSDPTTLTPVSSGGEPVCLTRSFFGDEPELRAVLPAGDYLVVVDDDSFGAPGVFQVDLQTFPDGFPPLPVCAAANALDLPAVGSSATFTVQQAELGATSTDVTYGDCPTFEPAAPPLGEIAYRFTPATTSVVTFSAVSETPTDGSDPFDMLLAIFEGPCTKGVPALACVDDVTSDMTVDRNSTVTATLTAGVEYTLVVDGFNNFNDAFEAVAPTVGATVTVTVAAP